ATDTQTVTITIKGSNEAKIAPPIVGPGGDYFDTHYLTATSAEATGGDDVLVGTNSGNDIMGQGGNDKIFGLGGDDTLEGNGGNDELFGGSGKDTITGGGVDDILIGGFGDDILAGSGGKDTFVYIDFRDTGDTVKDFTVGQDTIAFIGVLGVTWSNLVITQDGSDTLVSVDLPGGSAGEYEMQIRLENFDHTTLSESNFNFNYAATAASLLV
ncbi:MAG: hypothetical protein M3145_11280, partial [Pseudomonadota bacterium]|nr:hypothetical protein [Pseudomonadota bacterium]